LAPCAALHYARAMATSALPLFHLYGDPPNDQAFDFIHAETIASRSSIHDWTIRAHRHRNLFQVLLVQSVDQDRRATLDLPALLRLFPVLQARRVTRVTLGLPVPLVRLRPFQVLLDLQARREPRVTKVLPVL